MASEPTFGYRLRVLRERAGLSLYELAKRAGVRGTTVSRVEKGQREPGWELARKLARALGVSVSAFDVDEPLAAGGYEPPGQEPEEPAPREVGRPMGKRK